MATKPVITQIRQTPVVTNTGTLGSAFAVAFMLGEHGPFSVSVPADHFTPDEVRKRVQELADKITAITEG